MQPGAGPLPRGVGISGRGCWDRRDPRPLTGRERAAHEEVDRAGQQAGPLSPESAQAGVAGAGMGALQGRQGPGLDRVHRQGEWPVPGGGCWGSSLGGDSAAGGAGPATHACTPGTLLSPHGLRAQNPREPQGEGPGRSRGLCSGVQSTAPFRAALEGLLLPNGTQRPHCFPLEPWGVPAPGFPGRPVGRSRGLRTLLGWTGTWCGPSSPGFKLRARGSVPAHSPWGHPS